MANCDICYLFGTSTLTYTYPRLQTAKFPVYHFTEMKSLTTHLKQNLPPKSWVLIKGSQNTILLERAVEALLANPSDRKRLARRGHYWDTIRAHTK